MREINIFRPRGSKKGTIFLSIAFLLLTYGTHGLSSRVRFGRRRTCTRSMEFPAFRRIQGRVLRKPL